MYICIYVCVSARARGCVCVKVLRAKRDKRQIQNVVQTCSIL